MVINKMRVIGALEDEDSCKRMQRLAELRDTAPVETLSALINLLDSTDQAIRRLAAVSLFMFKKHAAPKADVLVSHLLHNPDVRVRKSCSLVLMDLPGDAITQAFIRATDDSFDGVVQLACLELGSRTGLETTATLVRVLGHRSWRVRLEACKALITQKTADNRVISTLEQMAHEPEAAVYDAEDDEMEKFEQKEFGGKPPYGERWGKLCTILAKARAIADRSR